jgi:hypothetical protein
MRRKENEILNPLKTMRKFCLECMCDSVDEVKRCSAPECFLYPYRFGKDPRRANKPRSEKQKQADKVNSERLKHIRTLATDSQDATK